MSTNLQQFICNLNENINIETFEQVWQTVLRTAFPKLEKINFPLHFEDWSDIYNPEIQLAAYLKSDKKQTFNLTKPPFIRLALFKFSDNNYRFISTYHNSILDGKSYLTLFNENTELELGKIYTYSEYFWRKSLSGVEAPTPLIKGVEEQASIKKTFDFSETLSEGLKFFAEENGLTLNTLVQAAWAILLSRYSGEDKVIFGATAINNIVPVCTQLDADMDVLTWLNNLHRHWLDIHQHEDIPLAQIQQWSDIPADLPLFDSVVAFEEIDNRLHLMLDYANAETIFGHLQTILISILANPTQNLSKISLLTEAEKDQLLVEWNNTGADYPLDKCVHQLFEEQVEKTPDAIAVKFADKQLTYRELNERANQVAHHLDVKPDTLVGLSVERSLEMIVGMLGILKAGAAYVPLDPSYPEERLNFILEDSGIEILLDKERLEQIDEQNVENPSTDVKPNNLAYVIYTSGSTGKPKGVLIEHKSLVNHTLSARNEFELNEDDRVLQFASMSFDAAAEEIYPCLITGATLVLRTNEMLDSISIFLQKCKSWGLTLIDLPTAYWHEITSQLSNENIRFPSSVRLVIIGGEQALKEQLIKWNKFVNPTVKLFNTYGPTETTIVATRYLAANTSTEFLIGKAIDNLHTYILDKHQHLVPIGVAGELHIGGVGLARGYLNRPELTAEKFISLFNQRLYKTGDLVRYLPDGNIEFLGRIDNQVKIRGFRIELGEIESVIMKHVSEVAVIVREDQPGNKRLVAYTVGSIDGLRDLVKAELPHYMVPSAFVSLEKMPLTPNGKIDRRALPVPTETRTDSFIAPRNELEQKIADNWQQVLGVDSISVHDNFFELGGHSLIATQLVSRLNITQRDLFEFPTIAELAERISEETETKETVIIPRSDQHDVVSFAQQRLWFVEQLEPNSAIYNIVTPFKISGNLNIAALQQSLNTIVERHEIVRTILKNVDGKPVPVVIDNASVDLAVIKLNGNAETFIRQEAAKPFDISTDLMLRATLLEVNSNEFVLILVMHHIASDGWSIGVLFDELVALYKGNTLPELAIQYSDFAVWQRQYLSDQVLKTQLSYWKQQLDGMPTALELPTDKSRPAILTTNGKTRHFVLPVSLANKLKTLSQEQGSTLFMTLLGAFQILLHRYSGQDDIVVGSPIAGRNHAEVEDLIGFFVNTLVLRSQINRDSSFIEFLADVREVALGAYANSDVPFEKLVEELQVARDVSRNPLFQVMFVLQNAPIQDLELPDLSISSLLADTGTAMFDLTLEVEEANSELTASFEYNTDLFDDSTIERMMVHFQTLLESIVANPKQSISELEILDKAEKDQLLVEWNNTAADYPLDKCVHQLFEEQVEKTPDAIAVKFEDQELTYRELNERANQVAHHLDVKPDTLVGLSVERSLEMMVGMLGILKAGAAYVPLDPSYPEERLNFILEDSGIEILLDKEALEQIDEQNIENPNTDVKPNNLAYVIYTSGSTGKPKGVLIEHQSLVNHNFAIIDEYKLTSEDKLLQFASFNFDVATEEIFPTLLSGATLILWKELVSDFTDFVEQQQLTVLNLPAQYWHTWVLNERLPSCVRLVIAGSETVPLETVKLWHEKTDIDLRNAYGPTECTITATTYKTKLDETNSVPIGSPIANTKIFILDKNQHIVPIGVPGELHIGGIGVARAYLNRPELTAEKFVSIFNQRLYKTGDLVRYLPDGNIEFLGRIDNQVKIRGFRIELGEIESVIMKHVDEAVVIVREDQPGNKRLVAYIVGSIDGLRDAVKTELPNYMVPAAFVSLEKMPLTPSGKIDRRALPVPTAEITTDFVAPRDQLEQQLAEIWQQVLGVNSISVHDNFFELGGHSLLAITLLGKIEQAFDKAISVMKLFQAPTIAQFADILREKDNTPTWRALLPIQTQGQRKPLFFIGSTDYARLLVPSLGNEQPIYGLNMFGLHSEEVLTVETMATEYLQEIRTVQPEGPYHFCGYCADAKVAFEMAQQLNKQGQEVAYLGFIDVDWYADTSLSLNQRASKLGKNIAKFGPSFITHKIKAKLKARKEAKILSKSEQEKQRYESIGEVLPLQLQHQFLIKEFWNALDDYQAQTYSGNLSLLLSSELIAEWEVDKSFSEQINNLITGTVIVEEIQGFHDTLFVEPQVSALGKQIKLHLDSLVYK